MRAGVLPKLLLSPSAILVLVCVYGYIMFTVYLSFTSSTMMPSYEWSGGTNYRRLISLENWAVSLSNSKLKEGGIKDTTVRTGTSSEASCGR